MRAHVRATGTTIATFSARCDSLSLFLSAFVPDEWTIICVNRYSCNVRHVHLHGLHRSECRRIGRLKSSIPGCSPWHHFAFHQPFCIYRLFFLTWEHRSLWFSIMWQPCVKGQMGMFLTRHGQSCCTWVHSGTSAASHAGIQYPSWSPDENKKWAIVEKRNKQTSFFDLPRSLCSSWWTRGPLAYWYDIVTFDTGFHGMLWIKSFTHLRTTSW